MTGGDRPRPSREIVLPRSPYMHREEVAAFLSCHPNTVNRLANEGILTRYRIKGTRILLFDRREVENAVDFAPASLDNEEASGDD